MTEILINILMFCAILLLLALTIGAIFGAMIMFDIRRTTKEVSEKVRALAAVFDILTLVIGGLSGTGKKIKNKLGMDSSNLAPFIAGLKKGLKVLFNK